MIFGDAQVLGPLGMVEARLLRDGDPIWAWESGRFVDAKILWVKRGQSRTKFTLHCWDGVSPMRLPCDEHQVFRTKRGRKTAYDLQAGYQVLVSEGAHRFIGTIGAREKLKMDEPEETFAFKLSRQGTILAGGFLTLAGH